MDPKTCMKYVFFVEFLVVRTERASNDDLPYTTPANEHLGDPAFGRRHI